jgi:hypothetical protein
MLIDLYESAGKPASMPAHLRFFGVTHSAKQEIIDSNRDFLLGILMLGTFH